MEPLTIFLVQALREAFRVPSRFLNLLVLAVATGLLEVAKTLGLGST